MLSTGGMAGGGNDCELCAPALFGIGCELHCTCSRGAGNPAQLDLDDCMLCIDPA